MSIVNANIKYPPGVSVKMEKLMRHMLTPSPYFRPTIQELIDIIYKWNNEDFELNEMAKKIEQNEKHMAMD